MNFQLYIKHLIIKYKVRINQSISQSINLFKQLFQIFFIKLQIEITCTNDIFPVFFKILIEKR